MVKILFLVTIIVELSQFGSFASSFGSECCERIGTSLNCAGCGLLELPMSLMDENITHLDLSSNRIYAIPEGSFEQMSSLKMLNVAQNPLQHLNNNTFKGLCVTLNCIDCVCNYLTKIRKLKKPALVDTNSDKIS